MQRRRLLIPVLVLGLLLLGGGGSLSHGWTMGRGDALRS